MRVAVITDIHANLPALEAVLETIEAADVDEVWCLGDVVGYGADPDACADLVRERCALCLAGNHDLAVLGGLRVSAFSEAAAEAVLWTRDHVAAPTLDFLRELEPAGRREGIGLFHASPRDPVWEYVISAEQADDCLDVQEERIALIGHSHVSLFFTRPSAGGVEVTPAMRHEGQPQSGGPGAHGEIRGAQAGDGTQLDLGGGDWLINPGSVGQPRDGDPCAAWLALDTDRETAGFHRVPYDVERAADSILAAGLPIRLADRLHSGQ